MHAAWQSGELYFAVGVGAGLKIEPADSAEAIGDVHLDGGGINRLCFRTRYGQLQRARTRAAVHGGYFLLRVDEWKCEKQQQTYSFHAGDYMFGDKTELRSTHHGRDGCATRVEQE